MASGTAGFGEGFLTAIGATGAVNLTNSKEARDFLSELSKALDHVLFVGAKATAQKKLCVHDEDKPVGEVGEGVEEEPSEEVPGESGTGVMITDPEAVHSCCKMDPSTAEGFGDRRLEFETTVDFGPFFSAHLKFASDLQVDEKITTTTHENEGGCAPDKGRCISESMTADVSWKLEGRIDIGVNLGPGAPGGLLNTILQGLGIAQGAGLNFSMRGDAEGVQKVPFGCEN